MTFTTTLLEPGGLDNTAGRFQGIIEPLASIDRPTHATHCICTALTLLMCSATKQNKMCYGMSQTLTQGLLFLFFLFSFEIIKLFNLHFETLGSSETMQDPA